MSANINIAVTEAASAPGGARSEAHSAAIQRYRNAINAMRIADDGTSQTLRDDGSLYPLRDAFLAELAALVREHT